MTAPASLAFRLAPVAAAALLVFAALEGAAQPDPIDGFERAVGIVVAVGFAVAALAAPPAWTLSLALVLSIFSTHWDEMGVPVDLDRVVVVLGLGSLLFREWRHRDGRLQTRPVDWLLMVLVLYVVVSGVLVDELPGDRDARFELIDSFGLVPFAFFFAAPFAFRTERDRRVLLAALVGLGFYLGTVALLETTGPEELVVPSYIVDENIPGHSDRARGPTLDAGAAGISMFGCGVAAALAFVRWRRRAWRWFALVTAALCALGVLFALTRAGWVAALVGGPLALAAARETRRYLIPAMLGGLAVTVVALAAIPGLSEKVDERSNDDKPVWDRRNSNSAALRMVEDRPLFGFGWDRFTEESKPYFKLSPDYPLTTVDDLHNLYLRQAVELGLVGTFLWLAAIAVAIGGAILRRGPPELRPWKIGLIAVSVSLFVAWGLNPGEYLFPALLMWTWAGVAWGARHSSEYTTHTQPAS